MPPLAHPPASTVLAPPLTKPRDKKIATQNCDATAACEALNGAALLGSEALMVRYATNTDWAELGDFFFCNSSPISAAL